jgi:hypothetical protein
LKAASRKSLAAALSLGAAVFTGPVQALQCAHPLFWRSSMPVNEAFERMAQFAESKVIAAQSIFQGHAIDVEFMGPDDEYPVFVLTFEVAEWIKGSGRPYARIVYESWCDGPCVSISEEANEILHEHAEKIYVADQPDALFTKKNPLPENIDGVFALCRPLGGAVEIINSPQAASRQPHKKFLLDLAMRNEIEKFSFKPRLIP